MLSVSLNKTVPSFRPFFYVNEITDVIFKIILKINFYFFFTIFSQDVNKTITGKLNFIFCIISFKTWLSEKTLPCRNSAIVRS